MPDYEPSGQRLSRCVHLLEPEMAIHACAYLISLSYFSFKEYFYSLLDEILKK